MKSFELYEAWRRRPFAEIREFACQAEVSERGRRLILTERRCCYLTGGVWDAPFGPKALS